MKKAIKILNKIFKGSGFFFFGIGAICGVAWLLIIIFWGSLMIINPDLKDADMPMFLLFFFNKIPEIFVSAILYSIWGVIPLFIIDGSKDILYTILKRLRY